MYFEAATCMPQNIALETKRSAPMPIAAANDSATADAHASCWAREAHGSWARVPRPGTFVPYETMTATADDRAVRMYREQHKAECEEGQGRSLAPRCFTSNQLYEWRPSGLPHMRAPTAAAEFAAALCRATHRLGYRRLVLIGDSIMRNQASSLISLMGKRADNSFDYKGTGLKRFECGASDDGAASDVVVELMPAPQPSMLEFILAPWVAAGRPLLGSTQASRRGTMFESLLPVDETSAEWLAAQEQTVGRLWRAFDDPRALYVLNVGAHYPQWFNTSGQAFRAFVRDVLAIRQLIHLRAPGAHLVYRSTPVGHPECSTLTTPADEQTYAKWATNPSTDRYDGFGWHLFAGFDRAAREIFAPLGAAFLDVASPSAQRPDAHTAKRHGGGRLPPDCLHWALPGVPDVWNYMLLGALMHCRV